jgi:Tfp pilus assembly protein PilW
MSFSYDISVRVSKALTTVTSDLYQLGFCTSSSSSVAPPLLQIAVAGSGTAAANAVQAKCYTIGTSIVSKLLRNPPFGTNASATYVYLRENSTNPAASVDILDGNPLSIFTMRSGESALFPRPTFTSGEMYAVSTHTSSTASLQVVIVGE